MERKKKNTQELPIIQQMYDLIMWYVPVLNKLPRDHKHLLGDRIITALYESLEDLLLPVIQMKNSLRWSASTTDWMSCVIKHEC